MGTNLCRTRRVEVSLPVLVVVIIVVLFDPSGRSNLEAVRAITLNHWLSKLPFSFSEAEGNRGSRFLAGPRIQHKPTRKFTRLGKSDNEAERYSCDNLVSFFSHRSVNQEVFSYLLTPPTLDSIFKDDGPIFHFIQWCQRLAVPLPTVWDARRMWETREESYCFLASWRQSLQGSPGPRVCRHHSSSLLSPEQIQILSKATWVLKIEFLWERIS